MFFKVICSVGAWLVGLLIALIGLAAVEFYSAVVHPFPAGFDGSMEQMCAHVARYPNWILATVVPMWTFIGWLSTFITRKLGGFIPTIVLGLLWIVAIGGNLAMLPYPIWFKITCFIGIALSAVLGSGFTQTSRLDANKPTTSFSST